MELTVSLASSLASSSTGSGVFAVATCTGGVSGGSVCDVSGNAASTIDFGSSEAAVVSAAVPVTASAAVATSALATVALATVALSTAVACGASANPALAASDGCAAIIDWHCAGVPDAGRTEAGKPGDDPSRENDRSAQRCRHCRNSPRVHHRVASRGSAGALQQSQACEGADFLGSIWSRNDANGRSSIFPEPVARMQRVAGEQLLCFLRCKRAGKFGPKFGPAITPNVELRRQTPGGCGLSQRSLEKRVLAATADGKRRSAGQRERIDVAIDAPGGLLGVAEPE